MTCLSLGPRGLGSAGLTLTRVCACHGQSLVCEKRKTMEGADLAEKTGKHTLVVQQQPSDHNQFRQ